jgi:hypothetical protein
LPLLLTLLSERHKLGLSGVTSLITGESRVITLDSFDITAERDATVIRDVLRPRRLAVFTSFPSAFLVHQRVPVAGL